MRKIYSLLLLGAFLLLGAGVTWAADPNFMGYSAIQVNNDDDAWYYCERYLDWCKAGAFNGANLGNISSLKLGGQIQACDNGANWGSGTVTMWYKFDGDDATIKSIGLAYDSYGYGDYNNNMKFQSGGSSFDPATIDISGLSEGKHTIAVWFQCGTSYDSNGGSNYVATFYVSRGLTLSDVGELDYGFATFCGSSNYTVTGATAYKAALDGSYLTLTAINSSNEIIPKNQGIILYGEDGAEVEISYTETAATASMTGNVLLGTTAAATTASLTPTNNHFYAFNKMTNTFSEYSGTNFPANKAYFVTTTQYQAPTAIRFVDDINEATDIKSTDANESIVKFIENGKLLIRKDGVVYDVTGRIVK